MLTHCGTDTIETARLILRPFRLEDAQAACQNWMSDPQVQLRVCEPVYPTVRETGELLQKYVAGYENPDYYRWVITEKGNDVCIGQIAYFLVDSKNHFGELEYCIGQAFQKRGYVSEAANAVVDYGFARIGFHKVQICHHDGNRPSQRVIENCGLTYEGMLRDYFFEEGRYIGRCYYSILRDEWERKKI